MRNSLFYPAAMVIITLVVFFITLGLTKDKENAIVATLIVAVVITVAVVFVAGAAVAGAADFSGFADSAVTFVAIAAIVAAFAIGTHAFVATSTGVTAFLVFLAIVSINRAGTDVSKKK
jgi:hypothetical protein